jgi:hypothetical protein
MLLPGRSGELPNGARMASDGRRPKRCVGALRLDDERTAGVTKGSAMVLETVSAGEPHPSYWWVDVWRGFRPYFVKVVEDFLVFVSVWLMLWGVHWLARLLPNDGRTAGFLVLFHETFLTLGIVLWSAMTLRDLYLLRLKN